MNKDTGMKAVIAILVIACFIQMWNIAALKSDVDNLKKSEIQLRSLVQEQSKQLEEWETNFYAEKHLADTSFGIKKVDLERGIIEFDFTVTPVSMTENMRVIVNNTKTSVELLRKGNTFVGTLEYPLDDRTYETSYYLYVGEQEKGSDLIDCLGAATWAEKAVEVAFDGKTFYGNDRFTIAGAMRYAFYPEEELQSVKVVFQEEEVWGDVRKEGTIDLNLSKEILLDSEYMFKEIYMEFVTADDTIYRIYPELISSSSYDMKTSSQAPVEAAGQYRHMTIILDSGTTYEVGIHLD